VIYVGGVVFRNNFFLTFLKQSREIIPKYTTAAFFQFTIFSHLAIEIFRYHSVNQETCRKRLLAEDVVLARIVLCYKAEKV